MARGVVYRVICNRTRLLLTGSQAGQSTILEPNRRQVADGAADAEPRPAITMTKENSSLRPSDPSAIYYLLLLLL